MTGSSRKLLTAGALAVTIALCFPGRAWASWTIGLTTPTTAQSESTGAPAAPSGASAACVSTLSDEITVTWNAVSRASTYSLYDETGLSGTYSLVTSGLTQTSWTSGALATNTYTFEVAAYVGSNWSGPDSSPTGTVTIVSAVTCVNPL